MVRINKRGGLSKVAMSPWEVDMESYLSAENNEGTDKHRKKMRKIFREISRQPDTTTKDALTAGSIFGLGGGGAGFLLSGGRRAGALIGGGVGLLAGSLAGTELAEKRNKENKRAGMFLRSKNFDKSMDETYHNQRKSLLSRS